MGAMLLALLESEGFTGFFDFLYLPIDFKTRACLGYAFVNLVNPTVVPAFWHKFHGYSNWIIPSKKASIVSWSGPHQGFDAHGIGAAQLCTTLCQTSTNPWFLAEVCVCLSQLRRKRLAHHAFV